MENAGEQKATPLEQIFVARQPIFDKAMKVWGYELLYRHAAGSPEAFVTDGDMATANVIADGITLGRTGLDQSEKTLINFPMKLLLEGFGFALPPGNCIIEILETVEPTPDVLEVLRNLKHAGYTLAVDDYVGQAGHEPLLELADIIKVDVLATPPKELAGMAERFGGGTVMLLAEKVEDAEMHHQVIDLGFSLFQGFFFRKPELVTGRKMSSSNASKVKLLKELFNEDYDLINVSMAIETDLSLSYRLLRYINSASFGRTEHIDSIRQAITVLGQQSLSKWIQAVLMSDLNPTPMGKELVFIALQRAKFLELLGHFMQHPPARPDVLFLLGLLSMLDAILGIPMGEVLMDLPLSPELADALKGERNRTHDLLSLIKNLEQADWRAVGDTLEVLKLQANMTAKLQSEALLFAGELMREV
jgi:EAL and modified HD-GYP domain-containing signal transduction protein